jgi:integrase
VHCLSGPGLSNLYRRKLAIAKKPVWVRISPGIHLGYRRNEAAGSWSVRSTLAGSGKGKEWIKRIGLADDLEKADGRSVLSFWQALDAARQLARRQPGDDATDDARPITIAEALDRYRDDLQRRGGDVRNAERARRHLPSALLSKPVALLGANELKRWRDAIAQTLAPASVNRTTKVLAAALRRAAAHDPRIANQRAWKVGLAGLPDAHRARNVILDDATVRRIVAAAHAHDPALGLLVEVAAVTGARLSQLARLEVGDLQADRARLMMPLSAKGRVRTKKHERRPVPIPASLAMVLKQNAAARAADAPLLVRSNGKAAWGYGYGARHRDDLRAVVSAVGLDPDTVTLYALRHSSIVRQLLANVPIRICAAQHDTSVSQIERNYSRYISEHTDALARASLLTIEPEATADNVVRLPAAG